MVEKGVLVVVVEPYGEIGSTSSNRGSSSGGIDSTSSRRGTFSKQ